jgi:hypothetical protein
VVDATYFAHAVDPVDVGELYDSLLETLERKARAFASAH